MTKLSNSTLFALNGSTLNDFSLFGVPVTANSMTVSQIEDEEIQGKAIKCINFNNAGWLAFNLDSTFLNSPWSIEWWEKDIKTGGAVSAMFTNSVDSSANASGVLCTTSTNQRCITNMTAQGSSSYFVSNKQFGDDIIDEWAHRAMVFDGTNYTFYQNGVQYLTFTGSPWKNIDTFQIGRWRNSAGTLAKKIYNLRVEGKVLYTENFTPSIEPFKNEIFHSSKNKGIYTFSLLSEFKDIETIDVAIDNEPYKTFNAGEVITVDTTGFEAKDYQVDFTLKSATQTLYTTEIIKIYSPQHLQESDSFNEIIKKITILNSNHVRIRDLLKEKLKNLGIEATETKISELLDRLDEVQAGDGLEFVEHDGAPVFLGTPKPAIELKTTGFQATDKTISLGDDKHYLARVYGTGFTGTSSSICNDGTGYIDTNYALKDEGAIVIKFSATDTLSKTYGRVFRTNTDGPSLYYKQATGKYEIKFYGVAGGYMQDIDPSSIKLKKVILTWSMKKKVAKLYADGALIKTLELDPVNFNPGSSLHIGDNQQFDTSRNAYTIPYYIYEFKAFDCYLDENIITEV